MALRIRRRINAKKQLSMNKRKFANECKKLDRNIEIKMAEEGDFELFQEPY